MLTAFFKLCSEDDFSRTLAHDKVLGGTTWNQVTKQETVVEGYPDVEKNSRSGESFFFCLYAYNMYIIKYIKILQVV